MSNWNGWKLQLLQSQRFLIPPKSVNLLVVHPTLNTSPRTADLPCQSEVSQVRDEPRREPCHVAARPRRERREPVWLRDYVRTVVVYPT